MSSSNPEVTDPSAFTSRSLAKQVLFSIVTFSLYWIYWFHVTHEQLAEGTTREFSPAWRTVGLFVPIYNFVALWRTSQDAEAVTDQSGAVLFLLSLVFVPAFWFLIQSGINEHAE